MKITKYSPIYWVFVYIAICVHATAQAEAPKPNLTVSQPTHEVSFSVKQLESVLSSETVRFFNPYYEKEKSFEAFPLGKFVEEMFKDTPQDSANWAVKFAALDGYQVTVDLDKLFEPGGYFVFRDIDMPDWEKMKTRQVSPAPFAIVWVGKEQTVKNGYPWPWQIASMTLLKATD